MPQIVYFVLYPILLGSSFFPDFASTTPCQVYPSEYAYRDDSVTRVESPSANCRSYPPRAGNIVYTHCYGQQLKLSDSDRGSNMEYTATSYYVWTTGSAEQLLFIFPTRVSLTTITLHYYSDSDRGLPRLRFYAVPDDFDVWAAPTSGTPYVDVASDPLDEEPADHRSVSINVNFNTEQVLMYKYSSTFQFAVSELEFFRCITTSVTTTPSVINMTAIKNDHASTEIKDVTIISNTTILMEQDAEISQATTVRSSQTRGALQPTAMVAVGVGGALLLILITSLIFILSLIVWHRKRGTRKLEIDPNSAGSMREDASYSILERGTRQQKQPQESNSNELYDQIHLSPSTGQTELISKTESETARDISVPQSNIYSDVDMENQTESQPISSCEPEKSTLEEATYAVVDKKKKKKKSKEASHNNANKKGKIEGEVKVQEQPSLDDMYAVVHKKPKKSEEQGETPPPIPASTVESLYTAVQKAPQ